MVSRKINTDAIEDVYKRQAHYSYLAGQVERLRPYYNYSQTEYDKIALSISEKFDEYKNLSLIHI